MPPIKPPYHFIPIEPQNAVVVKPVWHDGSHPDVVSGAIDCTMTARTPLFVGNYQFKLSEADRQALGLSQHINYDEKKTIIEPLRLNDGRVMISGTSLKGMLRHSISALVSSPMERVQEQTYSYRPHAWPGNTELRPKALVINGQRRDQDYDVTVFECAQAVFVQRCSTAIDDAYNTGTDYLLEANRRVNEHPRGNKLVAAPRENSARYRVYKYYQGFDGNGGIGTEGDPRPVIYKYILLPLTGRPAVLPKKVLDHFRNETLNHLRNNTTGQISSRHPNIKETAHNLVEDNLKDLLETFSDGNISSSFNNTVFWCEADAGNTITSMGNHFRYRWKYRDSIHLHDGNMRSLMQPLENETLNVDDPDFALSVTRALFGYVVDETNESMKSIAGGKDAAGDHGQLAGRVAINHAVEVLADGVDGFDTSRFIQEDNSPNVHLKILGQPKPSAVEFYLQQDGIGYRRDRGKLCTYGDTLADHSAGELQGRKFYLHQPDAVHASSLYISNDDDTRRKNQASIARFISTPETTFKFRIRFQHLRKWELGLLLMVLGLPVNKLRDLAGLNALDSNQTPVYAHKLGLARSLGLGSVTVDIDKLNIINSNQGFNDETAGLENWMDMAFGEDSPLAALKNSNTWESKILNRWLAVHRYAGRTYCEFETATNNNGTTIYNHHTSIRNDHIRGRQQSGNYNPETRVLDNLRET